MKRYNITDMNINGAGITRDKSGAVIFIPGAADGDICDAEINGGGKNYLTAEMRDLPPSTAVRAAAMRSENAEDARSAT